MSLFLGWLDKQVEENLDRLKRKKQTDIWVTDLVKCRYKRELEMRMPHVSAIDGMRGNLVLGKLAHIGLRGTADTIVTEIPLEMAVDVGGERYRVVGQVDALVGKSGVAEIWELKTGSDVKDIEGSSHHVVQVWVYYLMVEALRRGEAGFAEDAVFLEIEKERVMDMLGGSLEPYIVYVTKGRVLVVPVRRERVERAVREIYGVTAGCDGVADIVAAWLNSKVPLMSWECNYCPYRELCPYRGGSQKLG